MVDCPVCGQSTSKSSTRLIKDSCGHTKCRLCLLKEENGCEICNKDIEKSPKIVNIAENNEERKHCSPHKNVTSISLHCQSPNGVIEIIQDESVYDNHAILPDIINENSSIVLNESDDINNYLEYCTNEKSDGHSHINENIIFDNNQVALSKDQFSTSQIISKSNEPICVSNDERRNSIDVRNDEDLSVQQTSSQQTEISNKTGSTTTEPVQNKTLQEQLDPATEDNSTNDVNSSKVSKSVDNSDTFKKPRSPKSKNLTPKRLEESQSNKTPNHTANIKSPEFNLTDYLIFKKPNEKGGYTYSLESPNSSKSYRSPEFQLTDYLIFKSPNNRGGVSYSIGSPRISNHRSPDPGMLAFDDLCIGRVEEIQFDSNCDRIEVSPAIDIRLSLERDKEEEREAEVQRNRNYVYNQSRSKLLQLVEAIDKIEGIDNLNNVLSEKVAADESTIQEVEKRTEEVGNKGDENKENEECEKSVCKIVQDKSKIKCTEIDSLTKVNKLAEFRKSRSNISESNDEEKSEEAENSCDIIDKEKLKIEHEKEKGEEPKNKDNTELEEEGEKKGKKTEEKSAQIKATRRSKTGEIIDWSHIVPLPDDPTTYKCSLCDKVLKNLRCRDYHRQCSTGRAAYKCDTCNKTFVKKTHYEYHERVVHTGDRPFKCEVCGKSFVQKCKLNRHALAHKTPNFLCDLCGKTFVSKEYLTFHKQTHSANSFKCRFCPKVFKGPILVKRHELTHATESLFKCSQCPKKFKLKVQQTLHEKRHKNLRPYSCSHCNRRFANKLGMTRHLATHLPYALFICELCDTEFKRKDNLKRHVQAHHPEVASNPDAVATQQRQPETVEKVVENRAVDEDVDARKRAARIDDEEPVESNNQVKPKRARKSIRSIMPSPARAQIDFIDPINAVPVINGLIDPEKRTRARISFTKPIPLEDAMLLNRRIEENTYSSFPGLTRKVDAIVGRRGSTSSYSSDATDSSNKPNQKRSKTGKVVRDNKNDTQQNSDDSNQKKMDSYVHWRRRTAETLKSRMNDE